MATTGRTTMDTGTIRTIVITITTGIIRTTTATTVTGIITGRLLLPDAAARAPSSIVDGASAHVISSIALEAGKRLPMPRTPLPERADKRVSVGQSAA